MPEPGRHGLPKRQHVMRYIGSFVWQGALLAAGVLSAEAISSGTGGTWRLMLAVGTVFVIIVGGQIVLPFLGMITARVANVVITRWRWRRG